MERKAEKYMEECLKKCRELPKTWNYETGVILMGAQQMYEATGEDNYLSLIKSGAESLIAQDGEIKDYPEDEEGIAAMSCGRIFYFLYDKTKDEKYRRTFEDVMNRLRKAPRCECGNFLYRTETPDASWLDALSMTMPFYMEYETKYEKKEKYNDIINQFENVEKFLYNGKEEFCVSDLRLEHVSRYLAALIDVMDNMSFEIYEQYRKLQDAFKQTLKNLLIQFSLTASEKSAGRAMTAYCIIKACRMGILLKEKYTDIGTQLVERLIEEQAFGENSAENAGEAGAFLMAYGQYLQFKKCE